MPTPPQNVLIASARALTPPDLALLESHPQVLWCATVQALQGFWQSLSTRILPDVTLYLWAVPHNAPPEQLATENALRQQLNGMGLPYRTLHTASLLNVLHPQTAHLSSESTARAESQWQRWLQRGCEKCSDPVCEHRLFQDLIEHRSTQRGG